MMSRDQQISEVFSRYPSLAPITADEAQRAIDFDRVEKSP